MRKAFSKGGKLMEFWEGKRVTVTGGDGFVGSLLVEMLLLQGAQVSVATLGPLRNLAHVKEKIALKQVDLREVDAAKSAFADAEVVMHLPLLAKEKGILCIEVPSKEELGAAAGIKVPTGAIAIIAEGEAKNIIKELKGGSAA